VALECLEPAGTGCRVRVRVQPRASKNEVKGLQDKALKLRIQAPPVEGAANAACLTFLAALLSVRPRQCRLIRGDKSRLKVFEIEDLNVEEAERRLRENLP